MILVALVAFALGYALCWYQRRVTRAYVAARQALQKPLPIDDEPPPLCAHCGVGVYGDVMRAHTGEWLHAACKPLHLQSGEDVHG